MIRWRCIGLWLVVGALSAAAVGPGAGSPRPAPGVPFTVRFPDLPPTFHALFHQQDVPAQMTLLLPANYDPEKRFPLLVFLNGWDGGSGADLGVARALSQGNDFVCLSVPLFRVPGFKVEKPDTPGRDFIMLEPDGRAMWPCLKRMLAKLDELVPNLDPAHQVLGGFSNGAHAIAALLDGSGGEVARRFSAYLLVEGAGHLRRYDLLKGMPCLIVSSQAGSRRRAQEICETAKAAGAKATFLFQDVGRHDFPVTSYPSVRAWLRGPAMGKHEVRP